MPRPGASGMTTTFLTLVRALLTMFGELERRADAPVFSLL
jgi:hypothetical protein